MFSKNKIQRGRRFSEQKRGRFTETERGENHLGSPFPQPKTQKKQREREIIR